MRFQGRLSRGLRAGYTILETSIALVLFTVLAYSLAVVLRVGKRSNQVVSKVAAEDRDLRRAVASMTDDLRASRESTMTIATLADGNHQVRLMMPIVLGAGTSWGVHDRSLGDDDASQNRVGWSLQYTTRDRSLGNGQTTKELVRQIVDEGLVVQKEKVLAVGLRPGNGTRPGFRVVKTGDVWEITLTTEGQVEDKTILGVQFHVRTRN